MNPLLPRLALRTLLLAACGCAGGNRASVERSVNAVTAPKGSSAPRKPNPDPAFINLKWGPLQLAPGGPGTVELDLLNRGEQPVGPFRVAVYATLGRVVTANRTLLGSADIASLATQAQHVVVTFTAPGAPGSYAVGIEIDDQRQVPGDDRTNNTSGPSQLFVK